MYFDSPQAELLEYILNKFANPDANVNAHYLR